MRRVETSVWMTNSLEDIFFDTVKDTVTRFNRSTDHVIEIAANARESIQLAVRAEEGGIYNANISIQIPEKYKNCGINFEVGSVRPIAAPVNTVWEHEKIYRCKLPGYLPESIEPTSMKVTQFTSRSFFITAVTEKNAIPGEYDFTITLSYIDGISFEKLEIEYPLQVHIYPAVLPDSASSEYTHAQWVNFCGYSPEIEDIDLERCNEIIYGIENFSEEWFTLLKNCAKQMKKERINAVFVPLFSLLNHNITFDENGKYIFDFTLFDRFLDTFMEYGSVKYFIGCHLLKRKHQTYEYASKDPEIIANAPLVTWIFEENKGSTNFAWRYLTDADAWKHLEMLVTGIYNHLKERGLENKWLQHVSDECDGEERFRMVRDVYDQIHKWAPSFKNVDATRDTSLEGYGTSLDIHVPQIDVHEFNLEKYQEFQKKTNCDVWTYTCLNPKNGTMNRMDDLKLIATRLLHWYNYLFGANGYLHWAWNLWCYCDEPYSPFNNCESNHFPLDAWEVLPDVENLSVFETIRSRTDASGIEDYELLKICDRIDHDKTYKLASILINKSNDFTLDSNTFFRVRHHLLEMTKS